MEKTKGLHSTNYYNTLIEIAEDSPALSGQVPVLKGDKRTVAEMQYDLLAKHPYRYTSDDILFKVYTERNDITRPEYKKAREEFFSKGQPCFRASPLTKRFGFGIHANSEGKIALYGAETKEYLQLLKDPSVKKVKAMRSSRK